MKRLFIITAVAVTVLILVMAAIMANAKDDTRYEDLIKLGSTRDDRHLLASGDSALSAGNDGEALVNYMMVCKRSYDSASQGARTLGVEAHVKTGDIYFGGGNYANALDFYLKGVELSENTDGKPMIAVLYKNLGNVYNVFKEHEKAMMEYDRGLRYAEKSADTVTALKIYQNLIGTYVSLHDPVRARHYYEKSRSLPCRYDVGRFMNLYNLALLLNEEKRYPEAVTRFRDVAELARQRQLDPKYECSAYEGLYKAYCAMGRRDSTLFYMERCISFARESGLTHMFSETYRHLADFHESSGNRDSALRLRSEFLSLQDSIFDVRSFDILKNQQFIYEMNKTERRINTLHERERHHSEVIGWQRVVIAVAICALAVIAALLTSVYRKKRNLDSSYRNLYQLNRQLSESHRREVEQRRMLEHEMALRADSACETATDSDADTSPAAETSEEGRSAGRYSTSRLDGERQAELAGRISKAMEEEQLFCSPDFSLDMLAESVGSNSRYVSQAINEAFSKNFSNYVNEYRVRLACERLSDIDGYGSLTIKAIGESVGFKSNTTFLTVFKRSTGITPSLYLKLAREETERPESVDS